jgi:murein DD-endopeptidase MepM/ murein hydrolase activator NlpD
MPRNQKPPQAAGAKKAHSSGFWGGYRLKRISHLVGHAFRERELILRSGAGVRYIILSSRLQRGAVAVLLLVAVVTAWTVAGHREAWRLVDLKTHEVTRVEEAYRLAIDSLGAAVEGATEVGRAEGASAILALVEQNDNLQRHLAEVERRLVSAEAERERAAAAHETLVERLRLLDRQVRSVASKNVELGTVVSSLEQSLTDAMAERGRLAVERDRLARERNALKAEIQELERRQGTLTVTHEATIAQLSERTLAGIDGLKRLIGRTGLDADKLLRVQVATGQGGPFVPAASNANNGDKVHANLVGLGSQIGRLEEMRKLLRALPVGAPLDSYTVQSSFGVRRDPFTGQLAQHNGLDLSAPSRTPVEATASGIVISAGWNGEFGNMVEIDHGYGVATRYGHMSRIHVKVGQRVTARQGIGLVGSTGRSTGPHVHYEVLADGKNLNPAKFLEAARYVSKGQH